MVVSTGWADWAGSVGFDWTWPLDPKAKACRATPKQSMILLHGESHSVWVVWPSLDSLSTLSWPGMCRALRVT